MICRGKIYDVLAQTAESSLHQSANTFEKQIQDEFTELLLEIDGTFENNNSIALPQNLRSIFENLEFKSNNIPLIRRGDGIKIRHIPSMLRFIGAKSSSRHKTLITPQIWGFEEPENNVEFSSCFSLNAQFIEAAQDKTQVILTTHSPAIYNIVNTIKDFPNIKAVRYHVIKSQELNSTEIKLIDDQNLHQQIGFMPLVSPFIAEQEEVWRKEQFKQSQIIRSLEEELDKHKKHRIFVEGKSDKIILSKAVEHYDINLFNRIYFDADGNTSAISASDKAKAFFLIQKHNKLESRLKAALILDNDTKGKECKKDVEDFLSKKDNKTLRINLIPKSLHVKNLLADGFNINADLETALPEVIWQHAFNQQWLTLKGKTTEKFTQNQIEKMINNNINPIDLINSRSQFEQLLINYKFENSGKENLSKYIAALEPQHIQEHSIFECYKEIIIEISKFINGE